MRALPLLAAVEPRGYMSGKATIRQVLCVPSMLDERIGDYAQTEVATHYFWIADYTSM
jgi:hypothetical protein